MTFWNVHLGRRKIVINVKEVLQRGPGFMVILDDTGKQQRLSETDLPLSDRERIRAGSIITLLISESVTIWSVRAPRIEEYAKRLIVETKEKVSGPFFVWVCQSCGTSGYIEYEEEDDPLGIAERIILAHQKEAKPGCGNRILIFDHRGMENKESELFLSSRMAGKAG
jgi:hypothetical protein